MDENHIMNMSGFIVKMC